MSKMHTISVPYSVMKTCPLSWVQRVHTHKGSYTQHLGFNYVTVWTKIPGVFKCSSGDMALCPRSLTNARAQSLKPGMLSVPSHMMSLLRSWDECAWIWTLSQVYWVLGDSKLPWLLKLFSLPTGHSEQNSVCPCGHCRLGAPGIISLKPFLFSLRESHDP